MQDADQSFLDSPVLVLQVFKFLLRRGLGLQYPAEHHLGQLITASHRGLADERQQQGVALPRFADSQHVTDFQNGGLGRELAEFGVSHVREERLRIWKAKKPVQTVRPGAQRRMSRGPWRLLQPVETRGGRALRTDEKRVQSRRLLTGKTAGDRSENTPVHPRAKMAGETVERTF